MIQTTSNNTPEDPTKVGSSKPYDPLNQCFHCKRRNGLYPNSISGLSEGVYLLKDARGFKVCNLCADRGLIIRPRKMTKADKKQHHKMKLEMMKVKNLKYITVDSKGNKVE